MLGLTIATTLVGFALGSYMTYRYAPTIARAPGSVAVGLVICTLAGAACGLAFLYVYLAIYAFAHEPTSVGIASAPLGVVERSLDANIFISAVYTIATESGVLLALAAGVYLLAPAHEEPAP